MTERRLKTEPADLAEKPGPRTVFAVATAPVACLFGPWQVYRKPRLQNVRDYPRTPALGSQELCKVTAHHSPGPVRIQTSQTTAGKLPNEDKARQIPDGSRRDRSGRSAPQGDDQGRALSRCRTRPQRIQGREPGSIPTAADLSQWAQQRRDVVARGSRPLVAPAALRANRAGGICCSAMAALACLPAPARNAISCS